MDAARTSKIFDGWGDALLDGPQRGRSNKGDKQQTDEAI